MREDEIDEFLIKKLCEKVDKMSPQNMQNIKTVEDYLDVIYQSEEMCWEALSLLFVGSPLYIHKSHKVLMELDENLYNKFAEKMCDIINDDPALIFWYRLLANYRDFIQGLPFTKDDESISKGEIPRFTPKKKNK